MTSIVTINGDLYGDRAHVYFGSFVKITDGPKIFVSADGQFAYGKAGKSVYKNDRTELEETIRELITHIYLSKDGSYLVEESSNEDANKFKSLESAIIITRDLQICKDNISIGNLRFKNIDGNITDVGTGGMFLSILLDYGMDPVEAFLKTSQFDHLTSSSFDVIKAEDLLSFSMELK